jgi:FtsP/CotA-like multicopper oxidase with cupredoxin domain
MKRTRGGKKKASNLLIRGGVLALSIGTSFQGVAGPGFADAVSPVGTPFRVPTYFAHTPSGLRKTPVAEAAALYPSGYLGTGAALRKFIDPLPLPGEANKQTMADGTTVRYIPKAVPEKWVNPQGVTTGDDYYEIATVEYTQKLHSDLKKPTVLRGYVQLSTARNPGKQVPLTYPDGSPINIQDTNLDGSLKVDSAGKPVMKQALAYDNPHYLGPMIVAARNQPVRLKFHNLLPVGNAVIQKDASGAPVLDAYGQVVVSKRNGDLFLPVDTSLAGAGVGPDGTTVYTQNRTSIHLHGADAPWISDGTPLQWYTPAGEADPTVPGSMASKITDPDLLAQMLKGASASNVPDMQDPGPGAMTLYYPNGVSARTLWYHDHAAGITRLNVYAGMAAPYVITDPVEQGLVTSGVLPAAADTIPLVLQDKSFVPDDIALQDAHWNPTAWGAAGDMWFPHVYETVQDPGQVNSWNQVGRWHYGPWFWPVFPALYPLPSGSYGDVTTTPEAWGDTPLVNGVAYPKLTVKPKAYRFQILNASNDRMMTFNLFQADTTKPFTDPVTNQVRYTEVPMVDAAMASNPCPPGQMRPTLVNSVATCTPETWPADGRNGGVPSPSAVGPTIYQIGSEGGLLPNVAQIEPTPTNPLYDVGRATVLNVDTSGLFLGPAERADVVIDFSQYAGKTLLVYNDMFAPVPAGDPRNDYFTGVGDQSQQGGAEDTSAGYGPNTRTLMQIVVEASAPAAPLNVARLATEIPKAYAATQERPVVAQSAYNAALGTSWTDSQAFAPIYAGSLKMPAFKFVPGGGSGVFNAVQVNAGGTGYVTAPTVTFSGGGATRNATAQATLKISQITITRAGVGYVVAPQVTIVTNGGGGGGATATSTLLVNGTTITNAGSGYTAAPTVTFSAPQTAGGVTATGVATIAGGRVTGITITNPGSGYTAAPFVTFSLPPTGGTRATATSSGGVDVVKLSVPDPTNPASAGGGGYTDMNQVTVTFTPSPTGTNDANANGTATGSVFDVTLVDAGTGYTSLPTISFAGGGGSGASATGIPSGSILVRPKAIQELFEPTFGRLNATLGTEVPFTSSLTQTTIPLGYIDPPTEMFSDNETQIWKITHNGVDTHPVHFHLLNVQLINRVGWDGFVSPPQPNELGWKETVKMNPLEDVIVALRAKKPTLPGFGLPNSIRPLDPTQPLGSPFGFTQVNANSGLPATVVNAMANFGWEYVWHCHILGHEENDFMRPVVFDAKEGIPTTPTGISATATTGGITVRWTDNASTEYRYLVERATGATSAAFTTLALIPANSTQFIDTKVNSLTTYRYRVTAIGAAGTTTSGIANATALALPPTAPSTVTGTQASYTTATVSFVDQSIDETGFAVQASTDNGLTWSAATTVARTGTATTGSGGAVTATLNITGGATYLFRVAASNVNGSSAWVNSAPVTTVAVPPAPTAVAATVNSNTSVTLQWTDASVIESGFVLQQSVNGGAFTQIGAVVPSLDTTGATRAYTQNIVTTAGASYVFRVAAVAPLGNSAWSTTGTVVSLIPPAAPTALVLTPVGPQATLSWTDNASNETGFGVEVSVNGGAFTQVATVAAANATGASASYAYTATATGSYTFRVRALGTAGSASAYVTSAATTLTVPPVSNVPATPTGLAAIITSATQASLSWTDSSTNEANFLVERSVNGAAFRTLSTVTRTGANIAGTGTTVSLPVTIAIGSTYVYRVTARTSAGLASVPATTTLVAAVQPPMGLTATANGTSVNLAWTDSANETAYLVESSTNGTTWTTLATTAANATGYTATGLTLGTAYTFRVTARYVARRTTVDSIPATVTVTLSGTPSTGLSAPSGLTGVASLSGTGRRAIVNVQLNWVDNASTETSYLVQQCLGTCTSASNWGTQPSITLAAGSTQTTVSRLSRATTYSFRVIAQSGTTQSPASNIVTVTTP